MVKKRPASEEAALKNWYKTVNVPAVMEQKMQEILTIQKEKTESSLEPMIVGIWAQNISTIIEGGLYPPVAAVLCEPWIS